MARDKKEKEKDEKDERITDLAAATGMSKPHMSRIMRGERMPSLPVAHKMAKAMGMSMDELYGRLTAAA